MKKLSLVFNLIIIYILFSGHNTMESFKVGIWGTSILLLAIAISLFFSAKLFRAKEGKSFFATKRKRQL